MDQNTEQATPSPQQPSPTTEDPGKTLSIVGLILAFFVPLVGLILSIIGKNKSKAAGFKNSLATVGIVLNAVFLALGLLVLIFWFAVLGATLGGIQQIAQEEAVKGQVLASSKKEFAKGETAKFGEFEVKVNSVQRDFVPTSEYTRAKDGKEYVIVNITVKNTGQESKYASTFNFQINEAGVANYTAYVDGMTDDFAGGELSPGAAVTGNLGYEVTKGASDLKLQYQDSGFVGTEYKKFTYTLAI